MRRPLYGWLTAEAISLTGTRVSTIAIPLFVLETTGSAARTGIVALAEMLRWSCSSCSEDRSSTPWVPGASP